MSLNIRTGGYYRDNLFLGGLLLPSNVFFLQQPKVKSSVYHPLPSSPPPPPLPFTVFVAALQL